MERGKLSVCAITQLDLERAAAYKERSIWFCAKLRVGDDAGLNLVGIQNGADLIVHTLYDVSENCACA